MPSRRSDIPDSANWFVGEDRIFRFTVVDELGAAQDISTFALEWVLRLRPNSTNAVITKTTGGGGIAITDGPNGVCEVTIDDTDTLSLAPEKYFHTLRRSDAGSEVVLAFGDAILKQAATR